MNIKKEIEELKDKIKKLEEEVKKHEKTPEDYELYVTSILSSRLNIGINAGDGFYELGYIVIEGDKGECHFLTQEYQQGNWEVWKRHGFKVANQEPIVWKGLNWTIDILGNLRIIDNTVYDFAAKINHFGVRFDNDFLKKDSDNRIHLF